MMQSNNALGLNVQPLKASQAWGLKIENQEKEAAKLQQAAQMFEAQFVKMLMGEMRNTLSNKNLTSGGFGEEMFTSSLDEARADLIVQGRGVGISQMLVDQMSNNRYSRPTQFRMTNPATANNAYTSAAVNNNEVRTNNAANNSIRVNNNAGASAAESQDVAIKHDQVKQGSHSPMLAAYNEIKNNQIAIDGEPVVATAANGMSWPVDSDISSKFGMRFHPILRTNRFHSGMDIKAPSGTPIQAAAEGTVVFAGNRGALGKAVIIEHADGRQTVYGHCSKLLVTAGQNVGQGETIANVGRTGRATGPHLHFEVRDENGKATDPMLSLAPKTAPEFMLADNSQADKS